MTNVEIKRQHDGTMRLYVGGAPALNAKITAITDVNNELSAVVIIPTKYVTFNEVESVIAFQAPAGKRRKAA